MASFWSYWVIILTAMTIVGITWILFANRKREAQSSEKTTGHVYDGIEEYDNPLPAWWFYMFVITIVWGIGYLIIYPGMGNFAGVLGWTQIGQYEQQVAAADEKYRDMRDRYLALPVEEIAVRPRRAQDGHAHVCQQLRPVSRRRREGRLRLPQPDRRRLDLWGDAADHQGHSGQRSPGSHARLGGMSSATRASSDVTQYVLRLQWHGIPMRHRPTRVRPCSRPICAACHGADGTGNRPWARPTSPTASGCTAAAQSRSPTPCAPVATASCPLSRTLLSEDKIHILTAYVYGLNKQ